MAQATDIVLNGAGYMVQPGSPQSPGYKRLQDGYPEGLTQRTSITDFFGGQSRALQLERDMFYKSLRVLPTLGGQGVTPGAHSTITGIGALTTNPDKPDATKPIPHVIVRDRIYFAIGKVLLSTNGTVPGGSGSSAVNKIFDNEITDITIYGSYGILVAFGAAADIRFYNTTNGTDTVLMSGERAHKIEAYAGYAVWSDARAAANPAIIRMVKGTGIDSRHVSYDVFKMATVGGELMLITKQAIFTFTGRVQHIMVPNPNYPTQPNPQIPGEEWIGEFKPFYQQGVYTQEHDFSFLAGYGGRTLAWIAGGVHELIPSGDRAGWRSTGLSGIRCFGGTVAAGYAVVSIQSHDNQNEIWAYDGNGWWCIATQPMPVVDPEDEDDDPYKDVWHSPFPTGGGGPTAVFNNRSDLGFFRHKSEYITYFRLNNQPYLNSLLPSYPPTAHLITPMIDAADRDKLKAWRKVGAVFASPETHGIQGSADPLNIYLDYSTDAGATWTQAAAAVLTGNTLASMNKDLEAALSGVVSRFIMLRVRWSSVLDWAPILTGLWVEHEALQSPARRRKWQLRIHARDQEIDRDGVVLSRTGRELIEDLWQAWETDTPLTFRDIDYDTDPVQRTVRIVGISEAATQPFDHGEWGDSLITLHLVEV